MSVFWGEYTVCAINFLGFSIHLGKQGGQHGNEPVVALVRLATEMDEGNVHQVAVFIHL